ncbi:hypothetical protein BF49_0918 [Bradyrhizobium sp.]|nr:hypothetical protein BF49_0918 [Bradyrhizobium sp.]
MEIIGIRRHAVSRLALPASNYVVLTGPPSGGISGSWKRDEARRAPRWQHPIAAPSTGRAVKYLIAFTFPGPRIALRIWQVACCNASNWSRE